MILIFMVWLELALYLNWIFELFSRSRFTDTGSIQDRPRPGRKRTVRTSTLRKNVKLRIQRNPARSMRKLAKEVNIARESMRLLVRTELGMTPYKYQEVQLLSDQNKVKRLGRSRLMLARFANGSHNQIVFSDEKLFVVEHHINKQNDWILATTNYLSILIHFAKIGHKNQLRWWYEREWLLMDGHARLYPPRR